jgi:hypothetical protein
MEIFVIHRTERHRDRGHEILGIALTQDLADKAVADAEEIDRAEMKSRGYNGQSHWYSTSGPFELSDQEVLNKLIGKAAEKIREERRDPGSIRREHPCHARDEKPGVPGYSGDLDRTFDDPKSPFSGKCRC